MNIVATTHLVLADATSEANQFFTGTSAGAAIAKITLRIALVLLVGAIVMAIARAAQGNRQGAMRGFFSLFAIAALLAVPSVLGPILDFLGKLIGQTASDANQVVSNGNGVTGGP